MPIALYLDVNIPRAITLGLRLRQVDVLTAQEDKAALLPDPALLDRAMSLERVVFTFDSDFLEEASRRCQSAIPFAGVIYAHPMQITIGACIRDLELIAKACQIEEIRNTLQFLPLK
jgi:predicted nuclease of predicted toxin-antitoxin system